jgi:O-antigen ligase
METTDPGSSSIDAIILILLLVLGFIALSRRSEKCNQAIRNNRWVILLVAYCFVSVFWSDYPGVSFKRWIRGLGTLVMVLVVLTEDDPFETVKTMFRRCAFLMVPLSHLFIRYFREAGVYYEPWGAIGYCGVTTGKNLLGRLCLILGTYFVWEIVENRRQRALQIESSSTAESAINIVFLGLTAWLLVKANSATSLATFFIGVCILLVMQVQAARRNTKYIGTAIVVVALAIFVGDLVFDLTALFAEQLNRDPTLTGRTEIWTLSLQFVANPLIGVGYDSFWHGMRLERLWEQLPAHPIQAHSGYIDMYLQIGIIGLCLLSAVLLSVYKRVREGLAMGSGLAYLQFAFLIQYLVYNITEEAFKLHSFYWFSFLLITLLPNREGATEWEASRNTGHLIGNRR